MNSFEDRERAGPAAGAVLAAECPERQELLQRLRQAFDDYSVAVRESRERREPGGSRTEDAQAMCARVWNDLQQHQEKHRCWRRQDSK
jgi:hypothetical protein